MALAGLYSPGLFTLVLSAAIGPYADWGLPGAPFLLAAALSFAALLVSWRVTRPQTID